jgi:hypothetical protein
MRRRIIRPTYIYRVYRCLLDTRYHAGDLAVLFSYVF